MPTKHPSSPDRSRLEWLAVGVVSLVGLALRLWPFGRLGLTHFDEGIYAMAGSWVFAPGGLRSIDPTLIPYAPPGFTVLVGLMYGAFGRSDSAAIAVSVIAGTLTIPAIGWIARRTFGPGSGFAAATLASLSGPHIAFSRMALTDASFLLTWLVAIGVGMRFLERPTAARGIAMGLAVGLAQQFKYNGWLAGALVILTALIGAAFHPEQRRPRLLARTFGWGLLGALVAAVVVLPWYRFVEAHGGYAALLRHQQSYLLGPTRWLSTFRTQANQSVALSGSRSMVLTGWIIAGFGGAVVRWESARKDATRPRFDPLSLLIPASLVLVAMMIPNATWWLGLLLVPPLVASRRTSSRLVGVWWLVLSGLTPLYHPYARLWLPLHAVGWTMIGGCLGDGAEAIRPYLRRIRGVAMPSDPGPLRFGLAWCWFLAIGTLWAAELGEVQAPARILPGLLDPSDSLREAANQVASILPEDLSVLRMYGRPSLTFYLAGRASIWPQAGPDSLLQGGDARSFALLDQGMADAAGLPQVRSPWALVEQIPTDLSLPTLLDNDPLAALEPARAIAGRSAPLLLFHRRKPGLDRE